MSNSEMADRSAEAAVLQAAQVANRVRVLGVLFVLFGVQVVLSRLPR
jgi:hypothetical protein